jgi:menaquinone reductase, iron-sulfur cluster-binding subunit
MNTRYGMTIDVDRCTGCGACMVACAVENNVPPARPEADDRKGITWIRVFKVDNGQPFPNNRAVFVPVMCQQCGKDTPCMSVCPQQAVDVDPVTGVVGQMAQRCLGCRYCMTACPYHARFFNWWDPQWPAGMEKTLNPQVAPRMRGVVEKCNFCLGRYHQAREQAAANGKKEFDADAYVPACVEACPSGAIRFGNLDEEAGPVGAQARNGKSFRLLEKLGTDPKVYYQSKQEWVREIANAPRPPGMPLGRRKAAPVAAAGKEKTRG